ncbi:MAG TPA: HEPN domain-containing protein [Spirochaetia bacterium]|nr:HEPN domain-containing protein [Spirochaetia bacterium]
MPERSGDWYKQAERDLDAARELRKDGFHEWSCFLAQQAAEKSVKAVLNRLGAEAWGHSVLDLISALPATHAPDPDILGAARFVDRFYVTARYPNGWAEGTPSEYYGDDDARQAIDHSQKVLRFCHDLLAR